MCKVSTMNKRVLYIIFATFCDKKITSKIPSLLSEETGKVASSSANGNK